MNNFAVAAKSFIVKEGKFLLLRRRSNDVHKPGAWDIPGGRLDSGEDPVSGVIRETVEEAGINVEVVIPFATRNFTRDDGQKITMIIFICKPKSGEIKLSEEHQEHKWEEFTAAKGKYSEWITEIIDDFLKYKLDQVI